MSNDVCWNLRSNLNHLELYHTSSEHRTEGSFFFFKQLVITKTLSV